MVKVIETALYKLAETNKISLSEAKILNALYKLKAGSFSRIHYETGLEVSELYESINSLCEQKIISKNSELYYCENFAETISEQIRSEKKKIMIPILAK